MIATFYEHATVLNQLVSRAAIAKIPFCLSISVLVEHFRGRFEQLIEGLLLPTIPNLNCDSFSRTDSSVAQILQSNKAKFIKDRNKRAREQFPMLNVSS